MLISTKNVCFVAVRETKRKQTNKLADVCSSSHKSSSVLITKEQESQSLALKKLSETATMWVQMQIFIYIIYTHVRRFLKAW